MTDDYGTVVFWLAENHVGGRNRDGLCGLKIGQKESDKRFSVLYTSIF